MFDDIKRTDDLLDHTSVGGVHIAIEGVDGTGKTTIAKYLAKSLQYVFIEKPVHLLFEREDSINIYISLIQKINAIDNSTLRAMFYGFSNMLVTKKLESQSYITDRYILSNLCWQYTDENRIFFDFLIKNIKIPDLTVLLTADESVIKKRIFSRNPNDLDLEKVQHAQGQTEKMRQYAKQYKIPYIEIDTTSLTVDVVVREILHCLEKQGLA